MKLCYSFIYLYIAYCNHIHGNTSSSNSRRLESMQNIILITIYGAHPRQVILVGSTVQWTGYSQTLYLISRSMFGSDVGGAPDPFLWLFTRNDEIHSYHTKKRNHFHMSCIKTDFGKSDIMHQGAVLWYLLLEPAIDPNVPATIFVKLVNHCLAHSLT